MSSTFGESSSLDHPAAHFVLLRSSPAPKLGPPFPPFPRLGRQAREREMTRQLDKFEWKKGTDPKNPEALASRSVEGASLGCLDWSSRRWSGVSEFGLGVC